MLRFKGRKPFDLGKFRALWEFCEFWGRVPFSSIDGGCCRNNLRLQNFDSTRRNRPQDAIVTARMITCFVYHQDYIFGRESMIKYLHLPLLLHEASQKSHEDCDLTRRCGEENLLLA